MLSKPNRLRRQSDYRTVYGRGRSLGGSFLALKYRVGATSTTRIGIVVGSKVSKKATERNLIRRRLREIVRPFVALNKYPYDIVLLTRPQARTKNFQELAKECQYLLSRLQSPPRNTPRI